MSGITGACHHAQLLFVFSVETGFHYIGPAGVELLTSGDPSNSASQGAGIIGVSHCTRPLFGCCFCFVLFKTEFHSVAWAGLWVQAILLPQPLE